MTDSLSKNSWHIIQSKIKNWISKTLVAVWHNQKEEDETPEGKNREIKNQISHQWMKTNTKAHPKEKDESHNGVEANESI